MKTKYLLVLVMFTLIAVAALALTGPVAADAPTVYPVAPQPTTTEALVLWETHVVSPSTQISVTFETVMTGTASSNFHFAVASWSPTPPTVLINGATSPMKWVERTQGSQTWWETATDDWGHGAGEIQVDRKSLLLIYVSNADWVNFFYRLEPPRFQLFLPLIRR